MYATIENISQAVNIVDMFNIQLCTYLVLLQLEEVETQI